MFIYPSVRAGAYPYVFLSTCISVCLSVSLRHFLSFTLLRLSLLRLALCFSVYFCVCLSVRISLCLSSHNHRRRQHYYALSWGVVAQLSVPCRVAGSNQTLGAT